MKVFVYAREPDIGDIVELCKALQRHFTKLFRSDFGSRGIAKLGFDAVDQIVDLFFRNRPLAFPLEKCCFAMVNCVFSFVALLLVMIFTGAPFHLTLIEAVYPLVTLFFFSLGVGLFLAAATVFFRDIMHIWSVFITALLYFSAIFYDPTQMTFSIGGFNMQQIIKLNPMYWYITGFRRTVMWGIPLDFNMFAVCGICALISMWLGVSVFRKTQDHFVLHI